MYRYIGTEYCVCRESHATRSTLRVSSTGRMPSPVWRRKFLAARRSNSSTRGLDVLPPLSSRRGLATAGIISLLFLSRPHLCQDEVRSGERWSHLRHRQRAYCLVDGTLVEDDWTQDMLHHPRDRRFLTLQIRVFDQNRSLSQCGCRHYGTHRVCCPWSLVTMMDSRLSGMANASSSTTEEKWIWI